MRVEGISFSFLFSLFSLFFLWQAIGSMAAGRCYDGGAVGRGYGSTGINFKGISSFFNSFFFLSRVILIHGRSSFSILLFSFSSV